MLVAALFAVLTASAQSKHETAGGGSQFSITAGGGLSTLRYKAVEGAGRTGFGGNAGIGYSYFFTDHWGLGTGVGVSVFNGKYDMASFSEFYPCYDGEEAFEYHYTLKKYHENQQAWMLDIPLMVQFQTGKFYAKFGGKLGVPFSAKYNNSVNELQASGVYQPSELTLSGPAFMGFGTFTNLSNSDDLKLNTTFFAAAEAGVKWSLSDNLSLYTGAYLDYGLNNMFKQEASTNHLIAYNVAALDNYRLNSVLDAQKDGHALVEKGNPLSAGIKVSLVFGKSAKSAAQLVQVLETPSLQPNLAAQRLAKEQYRAEVVQKIDEVVQKIDEIAQKIDKAAQKIDEDQRLADEQRLAEAKARAQRKYLAAIARIEQPIDHFSLNSTKLLPAVRWELDARVALLQRYPDTRFSIVGHSCDIGLPKEKVKVGQRRADTVKAYFINKNIASERIISTGSKADTEPLVRNANNENRLKNRRVEIITERAR